MSRLGKTPISLPKGVELNIKGPKGTQEAVIQIKGPKGLIEILLPVGLEAKVEGQAAVLFREEMISKAQHGLYRALLKNSIIGVSEGHIIELSLIGVGYRAALAGQKLDLQLGFSHPTVLEIPSSLQVEIEKGTAIKVKGIDKREVGEFAAKIRSIRPPEPYKGKGVRYKNEFVRKKEGKAAKGK